MYGYSQTDSLKPASARFAFIFSGEGNSSASNAISGASISIHPGSTWSTSQGIERSRISDAISRTCVWLSYEFRDIQIPYVHSGNSGARPVNAVYEEMISLSDSPANTTIERTDESTLIAVASGVLLPKSNVTSHAVSTRTP
jgi:hypothetical protein